MARWEPDAEDRLRSAALDLFIERGYDAVTVTEIAESVGLTRRSFFRYFPDKREALFAGSNRLVEEIERRLNAVASDESARDVLIAVLTAAGEFLLDDLGAQRRRRAIIAASAELRERDRTKTADIAAAIARSLHRRGIGSADGELVGAVCAEAFRSAYNRALSDDTSAKGFGEHLSAALHAVESFLADDATGDAGRDRSGKGD